MTLTLILIVFLIGAFINGWHRGLFLELMSLLSTIFSFVVASLFYKDLANKMITRLSLEVPKGTYQIIDKTVSSQASQSFFSSISFLVIFIVASIFAGLFLLFFRKFSNFLSFGKLGRLVAGILSVLVTYFALQLLLTLLALLPVNDLQTFLSSSGFAQYIILHTPISSNALLHLFINNVLHLNIY